MQALGKNIIVKPIMPDKTNKIITLTNDKPLHWEVISIGEDVKYVKPGDKVLIHHYGTVDIADNPDNFKVCVIDNIYAKLM